MRLSQIKSVYDCDLLYEEHLKIKICQMEVVVVEEETETETPMVSMLSEEGFKLFLPSS
jgi:hypothetical protein